MRMPAVLVAAMVSVLSLTAQQAMWVANRNSGDISQVDLESLPPAQREKATA